jgi:imidazolonepropionase-like amidohydrolase
MATGNAVVSLPMEDGMNRCIRTGVAALLAFSGALLAQQVQLSKGVQTYVKVNASRVVLEHVRVIDGTGKAPVDDQNVVIENGKISAVQPGADVKAAAGETVLDLRGDTIFPGLVGMHDHMYYIARPNLAADGSSESPLMVPQMTFSSPRLYLAAGVTTLRTTGSVEPYTDLNMRTLIDKGKLVGPHMDVTGPYLEGAGSPFMQMHPLKDAEDARKTVAFWADQGATSFKAYMNITRDELAAAIQEAHRRGLKITGHLCSVTYPEAADLGIDNLEHGFWVNTQLDPGKQPDVCPMTAGGPTLDHMDPAGADAKALIEKLVSKHVAITSTLPVFENIVPGRPPLSKRNMEILSSESREAYLFARNRRIATAKGTEAATLRRDMDLEVAFVRAGGLLLTGPDPTGNGGTFPGFGDQRGVELLVEAGFTPVEAVKIATWNGALFMGKQDSIGSIAAGKNADIVVVKGNPAQKIEDIEQVEIVFKDGVGYDSAKLIESVRGRYGEY